MEIFKRFSEYCKAETNDNYAFGLKLLLDCRDANIKEVVLYEQYMELKGELAELKASLSKPVEEKKKGPKTMGSGDGKNE